MPKPRNQYPNQRVPQDILRALERARQAATMVDASFGFPKDVVKGSAHFEKDFEGHPDDYIKEKTRLYRETWIIGPLDRAIAWAKGEA